MKTQSYLFAGTLFMLLCNLVQAQEPPAPVRVAIAAQRLDKALNVWADQTGFSVMIPMDHAPKDQMAPKVDGVYKPEEALKLLLAASGLRYEFVGARTVAIRGPKDGSFEKTSTMVGYGDGRGLQLAQVEGAAPAKAIAAPDKRTPAETEQDENTRGVPEILVEGKRTVNTDIQRTRDDAQPYVVFDAEQIRQSHAATLDDFFLTRLPMNSSSGTAAQSSQPGPHSRINLRGLGDNQTLILVDGRRMPSINNIGSMQQPDVNGIPLSSIERIEILPSTASGIFGGGATGGVINIITKQDYAGLDITANYSDSFEGGGGNRRLDLSGGLDLEHGRTHLQFSASQSRTDTLLVPDRDFYVHSRALQLANNPASFYSSTIPPLGYTSNIRAQNGSNLVLDNLTSLNYPYTYVPVGYAGPASDGGAALVANAGQYNLALPAHSGAMTNGLYSGPAMTSATAAARREFSAWLDAFVDASWGKSETHSDTSYSTNTYSARTVTLAANAINNPFTTPITVSFPDNGLTFPFESTVQTLRAGGGVIAHLPRKWTASAEYYWSRSRSESIRSNNSPGDPDGAGPGLSFASALANGTLNVMADINAYPLDYGPYLLPEPNYFYGPSDTILRTTSLRASGPVFTLPAGLVTISGLIEHRDEALKPNFLQQVSASGIYQFTYRAGRAQTVDSLAGALNLPIFSPANARPLVRELSLEASIRQDQYQTSYPSQSSQNLSSRTAPILPLTYLSTESEAAKFTVGLRYSPVRDWVLRASYGTGVLTPSLINLIPSPPFNIPFFFYSDPKRGNTPGPAAVSTEFGGNPDLLPEESISTSAGVIWTPALLPGLRLSIDYTRIEKTDEIGSIPGGIPGAFLYEDFFPGLITRAALTPADAALGYTGGVITAAKLQNINLASSLVEAYDVQADYDMQTAGLGAFHFYAIASYQPTLDNIVIAGATPISSIGYSNGPVKWRGNYGLTWDSGPWTVGWNAQYYHARFFYSSVATLAQIATQELNQGAKKLHSQTYVDAFATYRFGDAPLFSSALKQTSITIGIQNLLNTSPLIRAGNGAGQETYDSLGDPRMRRFAITVRTSF